MADDIPKKNYKIDDQTLDETEVITRMLYVLNQFHIYDLKKLDWNVSALFMSDNWVYRNLLTSRELTP